MDTVTDTRLAILERFMGAANARDVSELCKLAHPEVEVSPTYHWARPGTTYHGCDGIRTLMDEVLGESPAMTIAASEVSSIGRYVFVPTTVSGSSVGEPTREVAFLFEFETGLVRL